MSEYILTHKHHTHPHAASGWRIHCGVEVTELSTNKQHSLSLGLLGLHSIKRNIYATDGSLEGGKMGLGST
jgi:hypothetical protein